jgi:hypothetical protein
MPGPIDDKQYPRRITLPTLNGKMGQYKASKPPFMNTQQAGMSSTPNATTFGQRTNAQPFANSSPLPAQISSGGKSFMPNGSAVTYNSSLFARPGGWPQNYSPGQFPNTLGGGYGRLGGDARIGSPFARTVGGTAGAGGYGGYGSPGMTPQDIYARDKFNAAFGDGWYENYIKVNGVAPHEKYRDERTHYYDSPPGVDGAIDSFIKDERNNARNAAQWAQEHGNVEIPQEMWERWYYANRQGMRVDDLMRDGSEVVY